MQLLKHMQPFWNNRACKRNHNINSSLTPSLDSQFLLPAPPFKDYRGERHHKPPLPVSAANF